jgi:hypothetical protein
MAMTDEAAREYAKLRSHAAEIWSRIDELTELILNGNQEPEEWQTIAALEGQANTIERMAHQIYNSPEFWEGYKQADEGLKIHDDKELYE